MNLLGYIYIAEFRAESGEIRTERILALNTGRAMMKASDLAKEGESYFIAGIYRNNKECFFTEQFNQKAG